MGSYCTLSLVLSPIGFKKHPSWDRQIGPLSTVALRDLARLVKKNIKIHANIAHQSNAIKKIFIQNICKHIIEMYINIFA